MAPPFGWRFLVPLWKALYFTPGPFRPDPGRSGQWNRGAYLVTALGHCGECHTPRDGWGGAKVGMLPDGDFVGDVMGDVVDETTGRLKVADLKAIILYLRSLPPVFHRIERKKK